MTDNGGYPWRHVVGGVVALAVVSVVALTVPMTVIEAGLLGGGGVMVGLVVGFIFDLRAWR